MSLKTITLRSSCAALITAAVILISCTDRVQDANLQTPAPYAAFTDGLLGSIEPKGWLRESLERQRDGLTGHPKALSYPYSSCLWAGNISRTGTHGTEWWRYEQTAYYTDGLLRLGYTLGDSTLIAKGEAGVEYVLSHATEDGILGVYLPYMLEGDDYSQWPFAVFFRAMQAMYQATGDTRIPAALERHFLSFAPELYKSRSAVNIEGMLWTYALTGNHKLLETAEKAWAAGGFYLNEAQCLSDEPLYEHGVTICEELKLPILLYAYTGNETYRDAALKAQKKLEEANILPDGVISSAEYLCGRDPLASHETCDIADYCWTLGYFLMATGDARWADRIEKAVLNAGMGCVTKDFRQLQYFSSVNQFIATGTSNHNEFVHGRAWMAYRPTHQTECCAGNVHRIMPNYLARMWMRGRTPDSVAAVLYGPSALTLQLEDGTVCTIEEQTEYPFGDDITFRFRFRRNGRRVRSHALAFSFRVPEGSTVEGDYEFGENGFATLARTFRDGESLSLRFGAEPVIKETPGGRYVQRGTLVYALSIPARAEADTVSYDYMHGKMPEEPGFDCLNLYPAGSWKWALAPDATAVFERDGKASGYPWEVPPVTVRVPAYEIQGWDLEEDRFTPPNPEHPERASEENQTLTLVPYGCTLLRLTVFPE